MKKYFIIIFLVLILFLSGCSGNNSFFSGNNKIGKTQEDNTGNGLEVDFRISKQDILSKKLNYEINLKNSGKEPITLTRENINLHTIQKLNDGSNVFTQDSLNLFYTKLLGKTQSLTLVQNQEKNGIGGILKIKPEYFENINNEKIDYILNIDYDYKTSFSNNIELNLKENSRNKLTILDSLSQAAPVKINKIKLENGNQESQYIFSFQIIDGSSFLTNKNTIIKFKNIINLKFRTQFLNNCKYFIVKNNLNKEVQLENFILNKNNNKLILKCLITINEKEKINTQISGELEYNYKTQKTETIKLPDDRIQIDNWN